MAPPAAPPPMPPPMPPAPPAAGRAVALSVTPAPGRPPPPIAPPMPPTGGLAAPPAPPAAARGAGNRGVAVGFGAGNRGADRGAGNRRGIARPMPLAILPAPARAPPPRRPPIPRRMPPSACFSNSGDKSLAISGLRALASLTACRISRSFRPSSVQRSRKPRADSLRAAPALFRCSQSSKFGLSPLLRSYRCQVFSSIRLPIPGWYAWPDRSPVPSTRFCQ